MLVVIIYEFIKFVLSVVFNDYVFSYILFPGLMVYGIIKIQEKDDAPFIKPVAAYLLIYYLARIVLDIYIK